ncbi:hypothetical protein HNV10_00520 [Winogradskyella litoriviva]|uniref:LPXTG-motif cell wall anchor domain-containing protein n=1 Tax=Winogradskyella litoriviva TaxID=1220182 RepID=A0ABX2DZB8_9FLAO|nr:hypothetical protein [Winogradskyella litoriviva]NRD21703.1 hypothetical protein [Winogradskyella litoriviva]
MKIQKIFHYAYIVFAILFLYDAISKWSTDRNGAYMMLFFTALATFMFFFRKRFSKRQEERNNK